MDPISSGNITNAFILLPEAAATHKYQIDSQISMRQQDFGGGKRFIMCNI